MYILLVLNWCVRAFNRPAGLPPACFDLLGWARKVERRYRCGSRSLGADVVVLGPSKTLIGRPARLAGASGTAPRVASGRRGESAMVAMIHLPSRLMAFGASALAPKAAVGSYSND
jgi:hypothetical protein